MKGAFLFLCIQAEILVWIREIISLIEGKKGIIFFLCTQLLAISSIVTSWGRGWILTNKFNISQWAKPSQIYLIPFLIFLASTTFCGQEYLS